MLAVPEIRHTSSLFDTNHHLLNNSYFLSTHRLCSSIRSTLPGLIFAVAYQILILFCVCEDLSESAYYLVCFLQVNSGSCALCVVLELVIFYKKHEWLDAVFSYCFCSLLNLGQRFL